MYSALLAVRWAYDGGAYVVLANAVHFLQENCRLIYLNLCYIFFVSFTVTVKNIYLVGMIVTAYKTDPRIIKKLPINPKNIGVPNPYLHKTVVHKNNTKKQ